MAEDFSPETPEEAAERERDEAALNRKGAFKPCEACGSEFFVPGFHALVQLIHPDRPTKVGEGGDAAVAVCENCGLIRLHLTNLLFKDSDDAAG